MSGLGIPCPHCGGHTEVKDSRPRAEGGIRRRRRCDICARRFTTIEVRVGDTADFLPAMDDYERPVVKQAHELVRLLPEITAEDRLMIMGLARRLRGGPVGGVSIAFVDEPEFVEAAE